MTAKASSAVRVISLAVDFWRESLKVYAQQIDEFIALADELMPAK